ncbi:GNAT family N-acetyltransferase [Clostridium chrysemydis]|uniref:GNAT family N-acetyltransferase n=1 Tax=Clostridium chrysemydis TaxID=2665504 RepID=UPI001883A3EC|nr:GNAT family N-acetyltransferase [Clostridium chrysemydis]
MDIQIKKFNELTAEELYSIVVARTEVFICEQKITSENEFDGIDREAYHVFLKEDDNTKAYLRILKKGLSYKDGVGIGRMLVVKEARRRGLAQELLKEAVRFIKEEFKGERILLSAQLYVKDLYESVGFTPISDVYDEVGIPHIKMEYKER